MRRERNMNMNNDGQLRSSFVSFRASPADDDAAAATCGLERVVNSERLFDEADTRMFSRHPEIAAQEAVAVFVFVLLFAFCFLPFAFH